MTSFIGAGVLTYIYYALPCSAEQKHVRIEVEGETTGTASYRTTIIIFACILIFAYPGSEFNSFTFLSQFLVNTDQGISKSNAAFMQTVIVCSLCNVQRIMYCDRDEDFAPKHDVHLNCMPGNSVQRSCWLAPRHLFRGSMSHSRSLALAMDP